MIERPTPLQWCIYALAAFGLHVGALALALTIRALGMR